MTLPRVESYDKYLLPVSQKPPDLVPGMNRNEELILGMNYIGLDIVRFIREQGRLPSESMMDYVEVRFRSQVSNFDFQRRFADILPQLSGLVDYVNQKYPKTSPSSAVSTLVVLGGGTALVFAVLNYLTKDTTKKKKK